MNKIKKIVNSKIFPFIILFVVMLSLSTFKKTYMNDDNYFGTVLLKGSGPLPEISTMSEFIDFRYNLWTSRVIIEFFTVLFSTKLGMVWRILDALVYAIMAYSIKRVFIGTKDDKTLNWIIVFLVLMIPNFMIKEAGYIATSLNYTWPIAFGLVSLIPIRKCLDGEKIRWFEYLIYLPLCVYADNAELVCACILAVYLIFTIYLAIKKKLKPIIILILILSILSMIFIMRCPGNAQRTKVETISKFSDYNNISTLDKVVMGVISTINYYFINFNIVYFTFTLIMMIIIFKKYDNILYKVIGALPFVMGIMFTVVSTIVPTNSGGHIFMFEEFYEYTKSDSVYVNLENFNVVETYLPIIIDCLSIGFLFISLYLVLGNSKTTLVSILALGAGLCSKAIMGFMPTVFASGYRTQFIFIVMMIALIVMILDKQDKKFRDILLNLLIIFAILFK